MGCRSRGRAARVGEGEGSDVWWKKAKAKDAGGEPPEVAELRRASEGLEYPSESDAPLEPFWWPAGHENSAREQVAQRAGGRKVEEVALGPFFAELEASEEGAKWKALRQALETKLSGAAAFRVGAGERKVDVYVVGRAKSGAWAGLHTTSVET